MAFQVNHGGLTAAASQYSAAYTGYSQSLEELLTAMESVTWDDASGDQWREVKAKASTELGNISTNLDNNSKLLNSVADAASTAQKAVKQDITNIYG